MGGQQTHGYDAVLELSEAAYEKILSSVFDTGDYLLGTILGQLGIPVPPGSGFAVHVSFDRPAGIPASATDVLDIRVTLGPDGSIGSLRFAAGLTVMPVDATAKVEFTVDLRNKLYLTEISIVGIPVPSAALRDVLANNVGLLYLLPLPVVADATAPEIIKDADVRLIDDASPQDRDASALLLTFGGGSPGDRNAFTQSFLSLGGDAGMAVAMSWLCRTISPLVDQALGGSGAFQNCRLTRHLDMGDDVTLTEMSVTLVEGALKVHAEVTKSGFCYDATGSVDASITIGVTDGVLQVIPTVGSPDIDIDIPWYCYLAAAVIGAGIGAAIIGAVGAVVGAVLLPTILYIAENVLQTAVNSAADTVADALNSAAPSINLNVPNITLPAPVGHIEFKFSDAFIDDVQVDSRVVPLDTAPVRGAGVVTIPNGSTFDFDTGHVGAGQIPSGDLGIRGSGSSRRIAPVCGAVFAATSSFLFDELYRAAVYPYHYAATEIPLLALGVPLPFGVFVPNHRIIGVRTNENRWAAFQVIGASSSGITIRYLTWESLGPTARIVGQYSCNKGRFSLLGSLATDTVFTASSALQKALASGASGAVVPAASLESATVSAHTAAVSSSKLLTDASTAIRAIDAADRTIGTFTRVITQKRVPYARFDARISGFGVGARAGWTVDGIELAGQSGAITTPGGTSIRFDRFGLSVVLTINSSVPVDMRIAVTVVDDAAHAASAQQCVHFEPTCVRRVRVVPPLDLYRARYLESFGMVSTVVPSGDPVIR